MKLNTTPVLDLSTEHLSSPTISWLERIAAKERDPVLRASGRGPIVSIMEREEGFFISSHHADPEQENPNAQIPSDLMHILRFAHANGQSYVLFDRDGPVQDGLPIYDLSSSDHCIDRDHPFIGSNTVSRVNVFDGDAVIGSIEAAGIVQPSDLVIAASDGRTLEDADYEAPEGVWIGIGEASVRINMNDDAVWMEMFARGAEMEPGFGRVEVLRDDLRAQIEAQDLDAQADEPNL